MIIGRFIFYSTPAINGLNFNASPHSGQLPNKPGSSHTSSGSSKQGDWSGLITTFDQEDKVDLEGNTIWLIGERRGWKIVVVKGRKVFIIIYIMII